MADQPGDDVTRQGELAAGHIARHAAAGVEQNAEAHGGGLVLEVQNLSSAAVFEHGEVVPGEATPPSTVASDRCGHGDDVHAALERRWFLRLRSESESHDSRECDVRARHSTARYQ